jgi:O-antigen ligase
MTAITIPLHSSFNETIQKKSRNDFALFLSLEYHSRMTHHIEIISHRDNSVFFVFVFLTLVAYIARIAEIFPFLIHFHVNLVLFVTTFILLLTTGAKSNISLHNNKELLLIIGFFLIALISIPFSVWPGNALQTCKETLSINVAIFFFCQAFIVSEKHFYNAIKILIVSCAILLYGLDYAPVIQEGYRVTTTKTYDSNDIALLFCFTFPVALSFFATSKFKGKLISCFIVLGLAIGIIKTGSRGGMIAFTLAILQIILSLGIGLRFFYKFLVVTLVIVFIFSAKGQTVRDRFSTLIRGDDYNISSTQSTAGGRLAVWRSGLLLLKDNFIFGVGAGNSSTSMGQKYGNDSWRTMHNSYLQAALEIGIIGFFFYLLILSTIWKNYQLAIRNLTQIPNGRGVHLLSFACSLRIGLVAYMVAGFFLSQAFSLIIPLSLALSSRLFSISSDLKSQYTPTSLPANE